jgi:hypothetical protein
MVPLHWTPYDSGAWVEDSSTTFWADGSVAEVCGFVQEVTRSLAALPLERVDVERDVLASEAADRPSSFQRRLLARRFGPATYGVANFLELGLRSVAAAEVDEWRRRHFTAGNAALWMTARPPDDLTLDLPPGEAVRPPEPEPIPGLRLPAQSAEWDGDVAFGMLARRSFALGAVGPIAERRAEDRLRVERGLTYGVEWELFPLTAHAAHLFLSADSTDANAIAVRDGIQAVLEELAEAGPTEAELERGLARAERWMHDSAFPGTALDRAAREHLRGAPLVQPAELLEKRRQVSPAAAAAALREALPTQIVLLPEAAAPARGRFAEYGRDLPTAEGAGYPQRRRRVARPRGEVVLGSDGASFVCKGEEPVTVRFDEAVALIEDKPGTFSVKSIDATTLEVTPWDLKRGEQLERAVRERVPGSLWVPHAPNVAALARLADALAKPTRVSAELYELPEVLSSTETPLALAEARRRRRRVGTVVATDRRLLWLYAGEPEDSVELPWEAVKAVRLEGRTLVVESGDEPLRFRRVAPAPAAEAIVRAFAKRPGAAVPPPADP